MPIPDYQSLMLPVLQRLADGADHTAGSVIDAMSSEFGLTSEEREQLVGSQRISLMASRVHWAMTYLAQAGLSDRPRRGIWCITDEGKRLLATNPEHIDNALLGQYEGFRSFISRSAAEPDAEEAEVSDSGADGPEAPAGVPSTDDLLLPMLATLSDRQAHVFPELVESICEALHLDDEVRARRLASGQTVCTPGSAGPERAWQKLVSSTPRKRASSFSPTRARRFSHLRTCGFGDSEAGLSAVPQLARRHGGCPRHGAPRPWRAHGLDGARRRRRCARSRVRAAGCGVRSARCQLSWCSKVCFPWMRRRGRGQELLVVYCQRPVEQPRRSAGRSAEAQERKPPRSPSATLTRAPSGQADPSTAGGSTAPERSTTAREPAARHRSQPATSAGRVRSPAVVVARVPC